MFTLTSAATHEIMAAAARSDAIGLALRVAAQRDDDGSVRFGMGFDEERVGDEPLRFEDLTVLVGSASRDLLDGVVLDFVELEPGQPHFVFIPPTTTPAPTDAAPTGCGSGGCGSCSCR